MTITMRSESPMAWSVSNGVRHTALASFSALGLGLLATRWWMTGFPAFLFLSWNLFLAWLPWLISLTMRPLRPALPFWLLFGVWLVFWPNAPYLLTDFVHLRARPPVPLWFDVLLLSSFAWAGCLLGWDALARVHLTLAVRFGRAAAAGLVTACVALCGLGVFLGRFRRLNSWDLVAAPCEVWASCRDAVASPGALAFSLAFATLVGAGYLFTAPHALAVLPGGARRLHSSTTAAPTGTEP